MAQVLIGGTAALLICIFLSPKFIEFLRGREFGQHVRDDGPQGHLIKAGTPTMGGVIMFIAIAAPFAILSDWKDWRAIGIFGAAIACALLGFVDDYMKIVKRRSLGLRARTKLVLLAAISIGLWLLARKAHVQPVLRLRVVDYTVDLGDFYPLLIYLVVAGTTSGVNLTDGLDGLAAGCAAIVLMAYVGITFLAGGELQIALLASCLVGACVGFLWFNAFPATIFMGDTGSLGLGRRDRRARGDDAHRDTADPDRRDLRDRGGLGADPDRRLPAVPQARVPDGPDPPSLRAEGVVGDEDHPALLDHHGDRRGDRLHDLRALDQVSRPPLPGGPYLVVGLARSGTAAALALAARGETVIGSDSAGIAPAELAQAGVELVDDALAALPRAGCVVKSPGVRADAPVIAAARERGVAVIGELELAWRLLPNPFVAVTGTNGKTTTVELIGAMYRAAGAAVAVAGNVGRALSLLATPPPHGEAPLDPATTVVCEASSFQLEDSVAFAPHAAVLLNLAPDHLDRHGDMGGYLAAKLRVFANQGPEDFAVLPRRGFDAPVPGRAARLTFGSDADADMRCDGEWLLWRGEPLVALSGIRLRGPHNVENAMAAAAAALACGLPADGVVGALASFPGVPHRLEEIATLEGVLFVNDSKGTNVASTLVALRSFEPGSVHLILGGRGKGEEFGALREDVATRARAVYLIGETAVEIAAALQGAGVALLACRTLERALEAARTAAVAGEVVLLSPAATSFDQFHDFEERGDEFRRLVLSA